MSSILYLTDTPSPSSMRFVNHMALHQGDVHILLAARDRRYLEDSPEQLDVRHFGEHSKVNSIRNAIEEISPDIVHVLDGEFLTYCTVKALRGLSDVKLVVSTSATGGLSRWLRVVRSGIKHKRVNHIICHSHVTRRYLRKIGISYDRTSIVYPTADVEGYQKVDAANLSPFGIKDRDFVISTCCDISPGSGVLSMLESSTFLGTQPVIHFVVMGRVYDERIYDFQDRNHTPHQVHLLGAETDYRSIMRASNLYCHPDRRNNALPQALIDAMGLGLPCVACASSSVRELIEHRLNGHIVHNQDPREIAKGINRYLRDPQLSRTTGDNARKSMSSLMAPKYVAEATQSVYDNL